MNVIIGVDPHKASHTGVAIGDDECELGVVKVRTTRRQLPQLLSWAEPFEKRTWAIESACGLAICCHSSLSARESVSLTCRPHWRRGCECWERDGRTRMIRTTRGRLPSQRYGRQRCGRSRLRTTQRCCAYWRNATSTSAVTAPVSCAGCTRRWLSSPARPTGQFKDTRRVEPIRESDRAKQAPNIVPADRCASTSERGAGNLGVRGTRYFPAREGVVIIHDLSPKAVSAMNPVDLAHATDEPPSPIGYFDFHGCMCGVASFVGRPPWELHPEGDELLHILAGECHLTIREPGGEITRTLGMGDLVIVPQGSWHSNDAPTGVRMLFMTPRDGNLHSWEVPGP
jgi:mannose-6-phosphate isomerase-like protein (cupin superfamily)